MEDRIKQLEDSINELKAENKLLNFHIDELYNFSHEVNSIFLNIKENLYNQSEIEKANFKLFEKFKSGITGVDQKVLEHSEKIESIKNELEQPGIDYSKVSIPERMILLDKLGIIDFLKEKDSDLSGNKLAKILSFIFKENTTSVQPYISGFSEHSDKYLYKRTDTATPNKAEKKVYNLLSEFPKLKTK